jgi:spermidine-citrate ligase
MTMTARAIAEKATLECFLNCYLRETGKGQWTGNTNWKRRNLWTAVGMPQEKGEIYVSIPLGQMTLSVGVKYDSPTGRHRFEGSGWLQIGRGEPEPIDYVTAIALLIRDLVQSEGGNEARPAELIQRVIQSCEHIERFVQHRMRDTDSLYHLDTDFIEAEQALLFGHPFHPTPKSRQGLKSGNGSEYEPELKGRFQLHYFSAHRSLVTEDSGYDASAGELIKWEIDSDPSCTEQFKAAYCANPDVVLLPVHPIQAEWLLSQEHVKKWMDQGLITYLGPIGRKYMPTSSIRTVYHPEARFMLKLSLQAKITNSMRVNKLHELIGGVEGARLLKHGIPLLKERFPQFEVIADNAYMTLMTDGKESGFEMILRENPFRGHAAKQVVQIAALVQDPLPGCRSRLAVIIDSISRKEGRSRSQVALEWFRQYMSISLYPMLWLYLTYGIALEAHQQNCLVQLKNGYPDRLYYRDNQGFYYCRSMLPTLERLLPGIGDKSRNVYPDEIVDERFRYYLIVNHMLGLINGFGAEGLIDERLLLAELRAALASFLPINREPSDLLHSLLMERQISCKGNLLTRLYDMDELENPLEQAVYVYMENPLVEQLPSMHVIHKAKLVTFNWRKAAVRNGSGQA